MKQNLPIDLSDSFEKIPVKIFPKPSTGVAFVAQEIEKLIREKQSKNQICVLGLATGTTPIALYKELVRLHKEENLSFSNVVSFNLDEYYPIEKEAPQSYWTYMHKHLFDHIDIPPENIFIPDGGLEKEAVKKFCLEYEVLIDKFGGIDLQILGIGNNGHIGFNEPGASFFSKTRLVALANSTRIANSFAFANMAHVPRLAITMGIHTIFKAKKVILMAWGNKSEIIAKAVEGDITEKIPASFLQQHPDCCFVIDENAAAQLTRIKSPWLTGDCKWEDDLIKKAVIEMALKLNKTILSLSAKDYMENGLSDLLVEKGDSYAINLQVFYALRDSITGWPGGKPHVDDSLHPERKNPYPKTSLIFSPHPDDDIISMGGTFMRLQDQGHTVYVAYQTSGNIAVNDEFTLRFLDFVVDFETQFGIDKTKSKALWEDAKKFLESKKEKDVDTESIRKIKGLIRRAEAKTTCRFVGIPDKNVIFQDLPFYETGTIEKKPMSEKDIELTVDLLRKIKPHQIFCAGDLADPHGTHKVCLEIIFASIQKIVEAGDDWIKDCYVWMYKGAWQEWNIAEIEMAVPMSPDQVNKKRHGIFLHQSQKDIVPFQGNDSREFWQRAEERNANTANLYAALGLTQYAAMEAFKRWRFDLLDKRKLVSVK